MIRTLLLAALLCAAAAAGAQDSTRRAAPKKEASVSGVVLDSSTRGPVSGATVSLLDGQSSALIGRTATDEKGSFFLLLKGTRGYRLHISAIGFKEHSLQIPGDAANVTLGTIALKGDPGVLREVVVAADKPLIEQRADRLVYNAEKDLSTLGGTAADVLRNVPMLSVDGNGNVQLRGSSNIRVLINNRPSTIIAASIADALRQLPADLVKTVEVITSPSAKYDAEGTAGIINIITKKNMLQGVTGSVNVTPGNVSTLGFGSLNFRRRAFGITSALSTNQFYNTGTTFFDRYSLTDKSQLIQEGRTRNRSGFVSPQLGFDVTVNEKNSLAGGIRLNTDHDYVINKLRVARTAPGTPAEDTRLDLNNRTKGVGYDLNLDYLRTFKDPLQEFSILTLFSRYRADNEADQDAYNTAEAHTYMQRNENQSRNTEATFQADYTQPFKNKTVMEMGAKTVLRSASSDVDYRSYYPQGGGEALSENIFSYNQDVWAAYLTYSFKVLKKLNVKTGARYEKTAVRAHFQTKDFSFHTGYDNLIPSFNASYTLGEKHSLRVGYTQRIQRPQLFFLNPYREVLAPQVIRIGNPALDAETASLYEISYGTYGTGFSLNSSLYARITNNAITSSLSLVQDTSYSTFLNIARNKTYGFSLSGNFKPVKAFQFNSNLNIFYSSLNGPDASNRGWMYSFFVGTTLDLGKGWFHNFTGSFNSRRVYLQGRMSAFYYHNTTLRKDIFKKRGSIGINLANPFMKGTRVRNDLQTPDLVQREDNINFTRGIRLSFSYRFGTLQQAKTPRKAKKTINNDDALRGQ